MHTRAHAHTPNHTHIHRYMEFIVKLIQQWPSVNRKTKNLIVPHSHKVGCLLYMLELQSSRFQCQGRNGCARKMAKSKGFLLLVLI